MGRPQRISMDHEVPRRAEERRSYGKDEEDRTQFVCICIVWTADIRICLCPDAKMAAAGTDLEYPPGGGSRRCRDSVDPGKVVCFSGMYFCRDSDTSSSL